MCFNPRNGKILISRDVVFIESDFSSNESLRLGGLGYPVKIGKELVDYPIGIIDGPPESEANLPDPIPLLSHHSANEDDGISSPQSDKHREEFDDHAASTSPISDHGESDLPPPDQPRRIVTRSCTRITCPNTKYALQISAGPSVPSNVFQAKSDPLWCRAMEDELSPCI